METVRPQVLSVAQLNGYIKSVVDNDYRLKNIFVCGEISNFTNHVRSGHFYMTIKDEKSAIKAVMFRSYAQRLKFIPENGMKVVVFGSVSVFERDGQYQLYIENMQPDGLGSLNLAFEQLKEKLSKEGLFAESLKKPIPKYPQRIGVVTSPTGAAVQDIKNVLSRRWPVAEVIIAPALVQGESAAPSVIRGVETLDEMGVDVIIVARGGGSIEDLWAFNDERLARVVAGIKTPLVSGVGHETDFTIIDFVADLRAPTPSAAAEVVTPDRYEESDKLLLMGNRMRSNMQTKVNVSRQKLEYLKNSSVLISFASLLNEKRMLIDRYSDSMYNSVSRSYMLERQRLTAAASKMDAFNPFKVLSRGYSIAEGSNGVIKTVNDVKSGDNITLRVSDGFIDCTVTETEKEVID
ncbi:MAG: exodeoxyribonuclease VII large subunit [Clostridia bacterium]|nr:exodeoxyribonuclease VII large subunit [Clostridia bacterium]